VPIVSVRIPQMGEGLQEALLVEFIKKPGDVVRRDEALYVMETDKATTEVESPYSGRLVEWTAKEGTVLAIGTEVARMEVDSPVAETAPTHHGSPAPASSGEQSRASSSDNSDASDAGDSRGRADGDVNIPPRTRKYLKDKGLLEVASQIPCQGTKLTPEDVDRYLAAQGSHDSSADSATDSPFDESPVPKQQITLNYRLVRSVQTTVPVTIMTEVDWTAMAAARQQVKAAGGKETSFSMMLWCVAQSLSRHPRFRTSLSGDGTTFRTYRHANFGVAVALPGDSLVTAVVKSADTMSRSEFFETLSKQIELARQGIDQADPSITVSVSNMGTANMRFGIPAIVTPAVATLALGEVFDAPVPTPTGFAFQKRAQLTMAFDHRVINGVGAAAFLNDLKQEIQSFSW
jgi:pyruvate/2-oxoglutarate dehydrogenase complex dihydrolipoamide acyltransferase (E2) component